MKTTSLVLLAALVAAGFARTQDRSTPELTESTSAAITSRILGEILDGTPPPPSEPKSEYKVSKSDILQTTTHEQGGRTVTIQQIKPIALPPPPAPEPALLTAKASAEFQQQLADYQAEHPRSGMMFIGATVYRSGDQPPRTLIHIWPQDGGKAIELWSNIDMALIAGGISSFQDSKGDTHSLMISWSNVHIDRMTDLFASKGREYTPPQMPAFPEGKATFQVTGKQPTTEDLTAIQSLHDLYNQRHAELLTAWQGRETARLAREAELKAHPPQPKDLTLRYWRTEHPVPTAKGCAR